MASETNGYHPSSFNQGKFKFVIISHDIKNYICNCQLTGTRLSSVFLYQGKDIFGTFSTNFIRSHCQGINFINLIHNHIISMKKWVFYQNPIEIDNCLTAEKPFSYQGMKEIYDLQLI